MFKLLAKFNFICLFLALVESNNVDPVTTPRNKQDVMFRVVNGIPAKLGDIPYQVSLKIHIGLGLYANFCGGSVIGENKILSAAHCFEKKGNFCQKLCRKPQKRDLHKTYAVAGCLRNKGLYKADKSGPEQWRKMTGAFFPSGYWFPKQDIAIAFTEKKFLFNKNVQSIPIATLHQDYGSVECVASGYGKTGPKKSSEVLFWAKLRLIPKPRCSKIHGKKMDKFICTSSEVTDVLEGDSGGPLVCKNTGDPNDKGQGVVVGVVCGAQMQKRRRRRPNNNRHNTFFTRVTSYQEYVRGNDATINLPVLYIICISLIISHFC